MSDCDRCFSQEVVLSYNGGFSWDMEEFEDLLEGMDRDERMSFFENLLPAIVNLALRMPSTCTKPPPLLTKGADSCLNKKKTITTDAL